MDVQTCPRRRMAVTVSLGLSLCATVLSLSAAPAAAQVVYSSLANPILPAATLPASPAAGINGSADDYQTTLAGTSSFFLLTSLQFYGGVTFTGAPDGVNNVLNFRFLNQVGGIPNPLVSFRVAFPTSGDTLQTIVVGANGIPSGSMVPTNGILEITTLNLNAVGEWAFTNTPPSVGTNNAGNAGIRVFALGGSNAPEPTTAFLLLIGVVAPLVARRSRRSR